MLADILPKIAAQFQEPEQGYRPRPSLAGPERCIRQLVYLSMNQPSSPLPGRALLVFDDSSWHEELTADWIQKTAYQLDSRQMPITISDCFPWLKGKSYTCQQCGQVVQSDAIHGHIDGIVTDLMRVDRLLEHKALNHFTFERIWKGTWPLDYFAQCALGIVGVRKVNPEITEALLLIKNKNTAQYLEILLRFDEAADTISIVEVVRSDGQRTTPTFTMERVIAAAVEKFSLVEQHRTAGTLPARPFEYGTEFPCGYCRFAKTCWEGYEQEFTDLSTDQELDQDLIDMAAFHCELRGHITALEEQKDEVRDKIKAEFERRHIRQGKTSQYAITLSMREKASWDESKIPADIVNAAKRKTPYLQLDVRKLKAQEATNGNGSKV